MIFARWVAALLALVFLFPTSSLATDWLPVNPEELKMASEPQAPGATAIILYRQVDRDDSGLTAHENDYVRIKILKEEGRKYADVEIPFLKENGNNIINIHARTIRADGSIVNFGSISWKVGSGNMPAYVAAKAAIHGLTRGMDFLMKMRDAEYGGYYDRVAPDLTVITDSKTGFSSFALDSLAHARACDGEQEIPRCRDGALQRNQGQDARRSLHRLRQLHARLHAAYCRRRRVRRGWRLRAGRAGAAPASRAGAALGQPSAALAARRHGVNLHMFEALLALYEATKSEEVWYEITSELKAIERLFDYEQGYFAESYDDNWKPGGNPTKTTRLHPRSTRCIVNT